MKIKLTYENFPRLVCALYRSVYSDFLFYIVLRNKEKRMVCEIMNTTLSLRPT